MIKALRGLLAAGESRPIRPEAAIEHDLYHAGEINRLRALRQGNDRWEFDRGPSPSLSPSTVGADGAGLPRELLLTYTFATPARS